MSKKFRITLAILLQLFYKSYFASIISLPRSFPETLNVCMRKFGRLEASYKNEKSKEERKELGS